jgi:hypothetical protein
MTGASGKTEFCQLLVGWVEVKTCFGVLLMKPAKSSKSELGQ